MLDARGESGSATLLTVQQRGIGEPIRPVLRWLVGASAVAPAIFTFALAALAPFSLSAEALQREGLQSLLIWILVGVPLYTMLGIIIGAGLALPFTFAIAYPMLLLALRLRVATPYVAGFTGALTAAGFLAAYTGVTGGEWLPQTPEGLLRLCLMLGAGAVAGLAYWQKAIVGKVETDTDSALQRTHRP